jgi:hypothetical protein
MSGCLEWGILGGELYEEVMFISLLCISRWIGVPRGAQCYMVDTKTFQLAYPCDKFIVDVCSRTTIKSCLDW